MELIAPIKTNSPHASYYAINEFGEICIVRVDSHCDITWNRERNNITPMFVFSKNMMAYNSDIQYNIATTSPIEQFGMNIDTWLCCKFGDVVLVNGDVFTLNSDGTYYKIEFGTRIWQIKSYFKYLVALTMCGKYLVVKVKDLKKIYQLNFSIKFNDITFEHDLLLSDDGDLYKLLGVSIRDILKNNNTCDYNLSKVESNIKFKMCVNRSNIIDVDNNLWHFKGTNFKIAASLCQYSYNYEFNHKIIISPDNKILSMKSNQSSIISTQLPTTENIVSINYNVKNTFMMIEMTDRNIYCCQFAHNRCDIVGIIPMASMSSNKKSAKMQTR